MSAVSTEVLRPERVGQNNRQGAKSAQAILVRDVVDVRQIDESSVRLSPKKLDNRDEGGGHNGTDARRRKGQGRIGENRARDGTGRAMSAFSTERSEHEHDEQTLWSRPGSNRLPPPCHGGALPDELRPRN